MIVRAEIGTGLLLLITNYLFVFTINVRLSLFCFEFIGISVVNCVFLFN